MTDQNSIPTWRVFCGIELPEPVKQLVGHHISALRRAAPDAGASWSKPENIHLTLKFLGQIPIAEVERFSSAVGTAVAGLPSFSVGIGGTGVFPPHGRPRVLWIGVQDSSGRLAELQKRLEDAAAIAGFERETRSFRPHLTLARLRKHDRREHSGVRDTDQDLAAAHRNAPFQPVEITVSELHVIRSVLGSAGSKYSPISRHRMSDKL